MKKTIFVLLLGILSVPAFSQKGDLTIGPKAGYVLSTADLRYNGISYGFDVAYHLSDPLEAAFTGLFSPDITREKDNLTIYSANLDLRLYLIHMESWATGPALGGQYYIANVSNKTDDKGDYNYKHLGFNLGWHFRVNLTDNLKLNAGWRYTNIKANDTPWWSSSNYSFDMSHHLFYLGIAYTFETK